MENHHAINGKFNYKWPFSIAMLNYQRVYIQLVSGDKSYGSSTNQLTIKWAFLWAKWKFRGN